MGRAGLVAFAPWVLVASMASLSVLAVVARWNRREVASLRAIEPTLPARGRTPFAGSDRCRACHPSAWSTWHQSFHRTMTQAATPDAIVLAPFEGERLGPEGSITATSEHGRLALFSADGESRPIVMMTGSHHLQVYWTAAADGSLTALPWSYLQSEQSWLPNAATLLQPPGEAPTQTWNRVCIKCHAVAGVPGWDPETGTVRSAVAELGIACEGCHGPAERHAAEMRSPWLRYRARLGLHESTDVIDPGELEGPAAAAVCGECHSVSVLIDEAAWLQDSGRAFAGAPSQALVRHPLRADQPWMDPILEGEPDFYDARFWSDGMIRVVGREYNGLVESPCFASGALSCSTCHDVHGDSPDDQLRPRARGDEVCGDCHRGELEAGPGHTRHQAGTAQCYDCHMPHTTYGLLKAVRSHQIDSPSAAATLETGRPNACNACHLDATAGWTAGWLQRWYGQPPMSDTDDDEIAAAVRWLIAGDAGQRALSAWHFGWAPALAASPNARLYAVPLLAELLDDPYLAVRWIALGSLRRLGAASGFESIRMSDDADRAALRRTLQQGTFAGPGDPSAVLLTADGRLDEPALRALLRTRDDRPISLAE